MCCFARRLRPAWLKGVLVRPSRIDIWVVVIPFWVPIIIRHLIFRVRTQKGAIILTTTYMYSYICKEDPLTVIRLPYGPTFAGWGYQNPSVIHDVCVWQSFGGVVGVCISVASFWGLFLQKGFPKGPRTQMIGF